MGELSAQVVKCRDLSKTDEASIFALYQQYYEICAGSVADDLQEKDYIILLRDQAGKIQGFSTALLINPSSWLLSP